MARLSRIVLCAAFTTLAGCAQHAAPSPQEALNTVNARYSGRDASEFFGDYGMPAAKKAAKGGITYRWVSILEDTNYAGGGVLAYRTPGMPGAIGWADPAAPWPEPRTCELRIEADKKNRILRIVPVRDGVGKYGNSYCAEIL